MWTAASVKRSLRGRSAVGSAYSLTLPPLRSRDLPYPTAPRVIAAPRSGSRSLQLPASSYEDATPARVVLAWRRRAG
jgi:hypothetical protein